MPASRTRPVAQPRHVGVLACTGPTARRARRGRPSRSAGPCRSPSRIVAAACRVDRSPSLPSRRETRSASDVGLPLDLGLPDDERRARVRLRRDQRPGEASAADARSTVWSACALRCDCLVLLVLGQVEVGLVGEDVGPAEVVAGRAVELLESGLVGGEVDEHVAVRPVRAAAVLGRLLGELLGRRLGPALVRDLRVQDDQPRLVGVGDVGVRLRADVDAGEVAARAALALRAVGRSRPRRPPCGAARPGPWRVRVMLGCRSYQYLPEPE